MNYKVRTPTVVITILLIAGLGTIGIQAAPTCQRIVKRYVERLVPAHFSKATVARWEAWNKLHPNYHPPKRKPRMTPKEVLDKVTLPRLRCW
jgi:hypothetical protein